jgi:radical SAM superfamily enzyme YgiQ (UPF0313 family)
MMNIALVRLFELSKSNINSNEHIGLGYLASSLFEAGFNVIILDNAIHSDQEILDALIESKPQIIGYTIDSENIKKTTSFNDRLNTNAHICFGGHHASACANELVKDKLCDSVIVGDGEQIIVELAEKIAKNSSWVELSGIVVNKNGVPCYNGVSTHNLDIQKIEYPDRQILKSLVGVKKTNSARIISSRGCQYNCKFCTTPLLKKISNFHYRHRDPLDFVNELDIISKEFGIKNFYINDDIYFSNSKSSKKRVSAIAEEIIRRNLKINYKVEIRADSINNKDEPLLKKLKQSGMSSVFIGIESGSQKMLDYLGKKTTVAQNENIITILRRNNISYNIGRILFGPDTDWDEIIESIEFFNRIKATHQLVRWPHLRLRVFYGTKIYKELSSQNRILSQKSYLEQAYLFMDVKVEQFCKSIENSYDSIWNLVFPYFENRSFNYNLNNSEILNEIFYNFFISNAKLKDNWSTSQYENFFTKLISSLKTIRNV